MLSPGQIKAMRETKACFIFRPELFGITTPTWKAKEKISGRKMRYGFAMTRESAP
jgi:hypothetical protein